MTGPPQRADASSRAGAPLLLLFLKAPERGQVKSRIAAALGNGTAQELYRDFVLDGLATIERTGMPFRVCYHPPEARDIVASWLGQRYRYQAQEGTDMGERMERAFERVFSEGVERALLIGSDLPDLPAEFLLGAAEALVRSDAVIGPARDGGYYLIGFRRERFLPSVFRNIVWSQPDVFDRTMQVLRRNGRTTHVLPRWQDVDTVQDLRDLLERNRNTAFATARTMRSLFSIEDELAAMEAPHAKV